MKNIRFRINRVRIFLFIALSIVCLEITISDPVYAEQNKEGTVYTKRFNKVTLAGTNIFDQQLIAMNSSEEIIDDVDLVDYLHSRGVSRIFAWSYIKKGGSLKEANEYFDAGIIPRYLLVAKLLDLDPKHSQLMNDTIKKYRWDKTFACFNPQTLKKIILREQDTSKKKGLVIVPRDFGESFAFVTDKTKDFLDDFVKNYHTTIVDVASVEQYAQAIIDMGEKNIYRMIELGHGNWDKTVFLYGSPDGQLDLSDETILKEKNLGKYFREGALVFPFSCSNANTIVNSNSDEQNDAINDDRRNNDNIAKMRSRIYPDTIIVASVNSFEAEMIRWDWNKEGFPIIIKNTQNTRYFCNDRELKITGW